MQEVVTSIELNSNTYSIKHYLLSFSRDDNRYYLSFADVLEIIWSTSWILNMFLNAKYYVKSM